LQQRGGLLLRKGLLGSLLCSCALLFGDGLLFGKCSRLFVAAG
jgi:hypothetical protein